MTALTVIIVSFNTRELTLKCLETLYAQTGQLDMEVVVFDNASSDGSADAVAQAYPEVRLIRSDENLGFAAANNRVAEIAEGEWLLLLNSDTEVWDDAINRLMDFAAAHPGHGIYGGRTKFPDGSLNPASCWRRITPWSMFCSATGLTALFPASGLFNPEGFGNWPRDTERQVDIVVGCFLLIPRSLWNELGGFNLKYFMYGEEADLCLRAGALGYRPIVTPTATIMHLGGASDSSQVRKIVLVAKARMSLIRDHWPRIAVPVGIGLYWLWGAIRLVGARLVGNEETRAKWRQVWADRQNWLSGYGRPGPTP